MVFLFEIIFGLTFSFHFYIFQVHCSDLGKLTCTNGAWVPDGKLITLALKCPLPLDGKSKSKGKTTHCAFKNAKLTDAKTGVTKRDQIASTVCGIFTQADKEKACKKKVQECLQKGNLLTANIFKFHYSLLCP